MSYLKLTILLIICMISSNVFAGTVYTVSGHPDRVYHAVQAIQSLGHTVQNTQPDKSLNNLIHVSGPSGQETFTLSLNCINKMGYSNNKGQPRKKPIPCENGQKAGTMCAIQNDAVNSVAYQPQQRKVVKKRVVRKKVQKPHRHVQRVAAPQPQRDLSHLVALSRRPMGNIQKTWTEEMAIKTVPALVGAAGYVLGQREHRKGLENRATDTIINNLNNSNRNSNVAHGGRGGSASAHATGGEGGAGGDGGDSDVDVDVDIENPNDPIDENDPPGEPDDPIDENDPPGDDFEDENDLPSDDFHDDENDDPSF